MLVEGGRADVRAYRETLRPASLAETPRRMPRQARRAVAATDERRVVLRAAHVRRTCGRRPRRSRRARGFRCAGSNSTTSAPRAHQRARARFWAAPLRRLRRLVGAAPRAGSPRSSARSTLPSSARARARARAAGGRYGGATKFCSAARHRDVLVYLRLPWISRGPAPHHPRNVACRRRIAPASPLCLRTHRNARVGASPMRPSVLLLACSMRGALALRGVAPRRPRWTVALVRGSLVSAALVVGSSSAPTVSARS